MPEQQIAELRELIGESRQTVTELSVEAGKVAEFARAIGSKNPVFYDREAAKGAGYDDIIRKVERDPASLRKIVARKTKSNQ
jgi:hypothetical protein